MGILSGLLSMFGWGTSDFLAAKSSRKVGYLITYFWTQLFAFSIAFVYLLIKLPTLNINNVFQFLVFILPAGFLYMVGTLFFYKGFTKGQVSLVSPIGASWAMITVILSFVFLKEVLKTNQIAAIILMIIGVVLVSINLKELLKVRKLALLGGIKEGLIAMLAWGFSLFLIVIPSKTFGWFLPVFGLKLFGIMFIVIYAMLIKQSLKVKLQLSLLALFFLVGFSDMVAFFGYSFGVEGEYASIIAPVAASFPLVTIILARIFLKERIVLNQAFGIVGIIAGLILISL
ncbi:DMT family transporter [Patescibacteria group bacterium]|nr:DMT family transporter [Patescibacteria group bacterium]